MVSPWAFAPVPRVHPPDTITTPRRVEPVNPASENREKSRYVRGRGRLPLVGQLSQQEGTGAHAGQELFQERRIFGL